MSIISEKAVIVGLNVNDREGLDEIERLTYSAGAEVVKKFIQRRKRIDPAYYIGKGKAQEIASFSVQEGVNLIVFDADLTPAQQRNLEEIFNLKVIDRTRLILDIFAQRARTSEGKLQVELAQLTHLLPRLTGHGIMLSQLAGGIGTRGPGETKLEYDRRRIRKRINVLQKSIEKIRNRRAVQRRHRTFPLISLVGYTNAGKSTLMNTLTNAGVLVDNRPFATLDTTTRKIELPGHQEVLITDTVGFIRNLPHHLIAAFRATLEEIKEADLLLHIVDISSSQMEEEMEAVRNVLEELEVHLKPTITVFNKIDKSNSREVLNRLLRNTPDSVGISALYGEGIPVLLEKISVFFSSLRRLVKFSFPYEVGIKYLPIFYERGEIYRKEFLNGKIIIEGKVDNEIAQKFAQYRI